MKHLFPLFLIIFTLLSETVVSQSKKHCDTPNELDLNTISKCTISKDQNDSKRVTLNVAAKKTRKRIVRRREKANSIKGSSKELNTNVIENQKIEIQNNIVTKSMSSEVVLFNIVDNVPLFPECDNTDQTGTDCFNTAFSKHFAKTFDPERASEDGVSGKVFIQFTIDAKGKVVNLLVKARKKDKLLESEIQRVVSKLPTFIPGRHQGLPVNVKYSLPINFSAE
ncbi:energy transducer TonB [Tenacibaculum sp. 190524A05c]|uniref:Periplasmic protein TonB n=1 Tax=Tenacibaculum platacis TaxID=3137852 RepID=A0ABP1ERC8_9FLAO